MQLHVFWSYYRLSLICLITSILFLFKTGLKTYKQQIINALEIWKEDLGDDYIELRAKLEKTKSNIPIISAFLNN